MDRIIMVGLASNKISHSEVFRRYIDCFKYFSKPDIFDLQSFVKGGHTIGYSLDQINRN